MKQRKWTKRVVAQEVETYFEDTESVKSMPGLALHLGTDSRSLALRMDAGDAVAELLSLARTRMEKELLENGLRGRYNATMASFLLKSTFGYSEKAGKEAAGGVKIELADELKRFAV